jgi:hypothetical protein
MHRDLPARANLEHLKKQAKDLLDAHRRGEREALTRIRAAVPAYSAMSDEALAGAPFALHDAQSAIAREHGQASWAELREAVAAQSVESNPADELLRALMPLPFPPEVGALVKEAAGKRALASAVAESPFPSSLPLLAMRDAIFLPRALGPVHVSRPPSRAAIELAVAHVPPTLAVFAQRVMQDESPGAEDLHSVGCEAYVHACLADGANRVWAVIEGVRWIELQGLEPGPDGSRAARVRRVVIEPGDPAEVAPLAASLRARARVLASAFPDGARLVALVDAAEPERLADLVIANLPVPVEDKASYAAERRLVERLRIVGELVERRRAD